MDTVIWYGLSSVLHYSLTFSNWFLSTLTSLCLLQLNSLVVLYKNAEGKNMNTSLSFLLFLNSVNSANLVRKSLMTTKAWQLLIAVLLYKKKKNDKVYKDKETWTAFSFPSGDSDWMLRMECLLTPWTLLLSLVNIMFPSIVYHLGCWSKTNHPVYPVSPGHIHLATKIWIRISLRLNC